MHKTSVRKCEKTKNKLNEIKGGNGMLKKMRKRLNNEKGLTLVELLAVIVILGIVAAIAVPSIGNIINNSEIKAAKADALNIINGGNLFFTENPDIIKVVHAADGTITVYNAEGAVTGSKVPNFNEFIQSFGSFDGKAFNLYKNSDRQVGIYATGIDAGGKTLKFGTTDDAAGAALIDDIDSDSADADAGVTFS